MQLVTKFLPAAKLGLCYQNHKQLPFPPANINILTGYKYQIYGLLITDEVTCISCGPPN